MYIVNMDELYQELHKSKLVYSVLYFDGRTLRTGYCES